MFDSSADRSSFHMLLSTVRREVRESSFLLGNCSFISH